MNLRKFIFDSQVDSKPPIDPQQNSHRLRQPRWSRKISRPSCLFFNLLAVFVVTLGVSLSLVSQTDPNRAILDAFRSNQYLRALQLIQLALKDFPRDPTLLTWKGFALQHTGQSQLALRAYLAALENSTKNLAALEGAAELEYKANSPRAIPHLERILSLRPDNSTSHAMLGVMLFRRNDCKGAVEHFKASEAVVNQEPGALTFFGSCLLQLGQASDAIAILSRLMSLMPDDPHVRYNVAVAQLADQQFAGSISTLKPLLAAEAPDAKVLSLASAAYEKSGDTPTAVSLLRRAILSDPQREESYLDFGTLSYNHNSFQVGIDVINAGLTQLPRSARLYVMRGILYVQLGKYPPAQTDFETAHQLDPSQTSAGLAKGLAQMQESRLDDALRTTEAQLEANPDDAFLYYLKAEILSRGGAATGTEQFRSAVSAAERAVRLEPGFVLVRDLLAGLYLKSGESAKAVKESRASLLQNPTDEVALYHLIQALRKTKGSEDHIKQLTKRLAAAREHSKKEEADESRYKLYIPSSEISETAPAAARPD